jgi:hypothetical protein
MSESRSNSSLGSVYRYLFKFHSDAHWLKGASGWRAFGIALAAGTIPLLVIWTTYEILIAEWIPIKDDSWEWVLPAVNLLAQALFFPPCLWLFVKFASGEKQSSGVRRLWTWSKAAALVPLLFINTLICLWALCVLLLQILSAAAMIRAFLFD